MVYHVVCFSLKFSVISLNFRIWTNQKVENITLKFSCLENTQQSLAVRL
jgi:hypothetical protein